MYPKSVTITEVGPREGMQIEPDFVPTADKIRLIDMLSECHLPAIEITSLVNPKKVPQMADAEEVIRGIKHLPGTRYLILTLNPQGTRRALELGRGEPQPFFTLNVSQTFSKQNVGRSADEVLNRMPKEIQVWREFGKSMDSLAITTVWGCNYEGNTPLSSLLSWIERALEMASAHDHHFKNVTLADSTGWATPITVKRVVGALQDRWPELQLRIHLHDTHGLGLANANAALEMGITEFESSIGGIGGCPFLGSRNRMAAGNIATEDLVHLCHESGIETGIDYERLLDAAREAEAILKHPLPGKNMHTGSLSHIRSVSQTAARAA